MNARGISPAAQQVFAVLICPGGVPTLAGGVPTLVGVSTQARGIPTRGGGYLPLPGRYLPLPGGNYLGWGVPTLARWHLPWLGGGGTYSGWGTPPPPGCGQTDACEYSTFPHPSDAGGNK